MNELTKETISLGCMILGAVILTVITTTLYLEKTISCEDDYEKKYHGLRIPSRTKLAALEKAREYDEYGNWVCVNVRELDYEGALNVCKHEVAHEIFARECSGNMTKCLDVMEDQNDKFKIIFEEK